MFNALPLTTDDRAVALMCFQEKLGYFFRERELLVTALCHSSYAHEHGLPQYNERLEFLGDSVLGMTVAHTLYEALPSASEGELSSRRVRFVCRQALALWAENLNIDSVFMHGRSLKGELPSSVYADAMEAVLGAVYFDGGLDAAFIVVRRYLFGMDVSLVPSGNMNAKSKLQALLQAQDLGLPRYELLSVKGPDHAPRFCVKVWAGDGTWTAEGGSRKEAELAAAANALAGLAAHGETVA